MRIVVINNFFPPRAGGSSHLSHSLAVGYAAAGHEVIVVTAAYQDAPAYEEAEGLKIFRLPAMAFPQSKLPVSFDMAFTVRPSLRRRLGGILDVYRPDVIHQHGQFFDLTWASGLWARKHRVPTLLSVHTRLESPTRSIDRAFRALDAGLVAPVLRRYQPTFVVMDVQMDAYIRARYRTAIGGIAHIPVGVTLDKVLGGDASTVRHRHELSTDTPVILSIGQVIEMRNRLQLIEALPAVRRAVPNAKLLIVGRVYYDAFAVRAAELSVHDMVISTGAVPRDEIPNYLAAADVESHDLQGYGLGTASLESMGAGVPVIAAVRTDNFPGVELIDGTNCWLVEQGDAASLARALIQALTEPGRRHQVGAAGRQLVTEHFTMESVLDQHLTVLDTLTSGGRGD